MILKSRESEKCDAVNLGRMHFQWFGSFSMGMQQMHLWRRGFRFNLSKPEGRKHKRRCEENNTKVKFLMALKNNQMTEKSKCENEFRLNSSHGS